MLRSERGIYFPINLDFARPDFQGEWNHESEGERSAFNMYVLSRGFVQEEDIDFLREKHARLILPYGLTMKPLIGAQLIEGIITDDIGLASFSGVDTGAGISFLKDYFPHLKLKGSPRIEYMGEYSGDNWGSIVQGTFRYPPAFEGKFSMRPVK